MTTIPLTPPQIFLIILAAFLAGFLFAFLAAMATVKIDTREKIKEIERDRESLKIVK